MAEGMKAQTAGSAGGRPPPKKFHKNLISHVPYYYIDKGAKISPKTV